MTNLPLYQKIFRTTFLHSAVRAFFTASTAGFTIFIVRLLGPEEFGKFSLVLQLAVTFGLFLSWGFSGTLAKFLPEQSSEEARTRLGSQALEISFLSWTVFGVIFAALYIALPNLFPAEMKSVKLAFVFYVLLFAVWNVLQGIYRGRNEFIRWSFLEGGNDFCARALTLLILWAAMPEFTAAFYCFGGILLLFASYAIAAMRKSIRAADLNLDPKVLRFSGAVLLGSVVFMVGSSADAVLLRALLKEPGQVGFYFAGIRIPQILQSLLLAPLSIPFVYYFTHPDTAHTREQIMKMGTKLGGVVCGLVSLFLFSFGPVLIPFLFKKIYSASVPVLQIYSFVFFIMGLQSLMGPFFMAVNKLHVQVALGVASALLLLGLDFLLIPVWKSSGAALANVIMLSVQTLCATMILTRYGTNLVRPCLLLFAGILFAVSVEIFWVRYSSLPVFVLYVYLARILSRDEIEKIRLVIFSKRSGETVS